MAGIQEEYKEKFEIDKVKHSVADPITKKSRIDEVKKSFLTKKNSSIKTIFTITNSMMGSALVVFPLIFSTSGLVTSLIVLCFVGAISCKTCLLEIIHFKMSELDFPDAIQRILGRKWYLAYSWCSVLLLYVTGMVYFTLICSMIYPFLKYILDSAGVSIAQMDVLEFGKFSYQYTGMIMIVVCFFFFSLKDLKMILKMGQNGIIAIAVFFVYIVVRGFMNIPNISTDNVKIYTFDVANLCGVFALSFFVHNLIIPIMKNNRDEDKNQRDVVFGYTLTGALYIVIGVFGTFSIAGIALEGKKANTVLDYYTPDVGTAIIEILLFLQLLSVEPILWYVCRSQFFNLVFKNEAVPNKYFFLSNAVFSASCLIIQMLNVDPTLIISLDGAICGFLLVYVIPIKMHLKCLYTDPHELRESLLREDNVNDAEDNASMITSIDDGAKVSGLRIDKLIDTDGPVKNMHACNSMHTKIKGRIPKNMRYFFYFMLTMVGLAFAVIKIVNLALGN